MALHQLKTDPIPFQDVLDKDKTFEIRLNDRDFKVGDYLELLETKYSTEEMLMSKKPLEYTGRYIQATITHMLQNYQGLRDGWCILSFRFVLSGKHV